MALSLQGRVVCVSKTQPPRAPGPQVLISQECSMLHGKVGGGSSKAGPLFLSSQPTASALRFLFEWIRKWSCDVVFLVSLLPRSEP